MTLLPRHVLGSLLITRRGVVASRRWLMLGLSFLMALLLMEVLLVASAEAGCGSYVRVGNWQHGGRQHDGRQLGASGALDWRMGGAGGRAPQGLHLTSLHLNSPRQHLVGYDEGPTDCQGPNCSRQSPLRKIPAPTSVSRSHVPELIPLVCEVWSPQFSCCGWLTWDAASPLQWAASILRPPRVAVS